MKIRILWVGKTKEAYAKEGIRKYLKLIEPFAGVEVIEIKEEKGKPLNIMLKEEGLRILRKSNSYVLLDEKGRMLTSDGLASFLGDFASVNFVLGGPYGVSGEVRNKASAIISLSSMTLPHEMARLVFVEQLYRAMTINAGRRYHH